MATTLFAGVVALVSTTFGSICKLDEFQCLHPDDGCIPYEDSCDGWIDCMRDGSDESEKECGTSNEWTRYKPKGYQFCDDGIHVIRKEKFCDGSDKGGCRDESDEAAIYCEEPYFTGCPSGMFQCTVEGLCISNELVCDGTFHCKQNLTDEDFHVCDKWECTKGYVKLSGCEDNELQCYNTDTCIPQSYRCDGFPDCSLGFDESSELCSTNWVQPKGYCYQETLVCDGIKNLNNEADEKNCLDWICADGYRKCADNRQCIHERNFCDLDNDCHDGSDEIGCENYTCPADTWKCKYSHKCIDEGFVCNEYQGVFSMGDCCSGDYFWCGDTSDEDEETCRNYSCPSGLRKTHSHKCISDFLVCNGNIDIEDGSDEENCETHTCIEGYVKCGDLKTCIETQHVCGKTLPWYKRRNDAGRGEYDEALNCPDGSDELCGDPCVPEGFTGRFTMKKCSEDDSVCIPVFWYCDGKSDCPKGSDERSCTCEQLSMGHCQSVDNMETCMPESWICNGHPNCTKNDSNICTEPLEEEKCTHDQFWCHFEEDPEKQCLELSKKCDNVTDCSGGEDEAYCFDDEETERPNYVYASDSEEDNYKGVFWYSDPRCFFQPDVWKCYDLNFVLKTIIIYKLTWIDVVYIEDIERTEGSKYEIDQERKIPHISRTIKVKCKKKGICTYKSWLSITARVFERYLSFILENIKFINAKITMYNINIRFKNVQFIDSSLDDFLFPSSPVNVKDLLVTFSSVKIVHYELNEKSCIKFDNSPNQFIHIENSYLENCNVIVQASNIWFKISNTTTNSRFSVQAKSILYLYVTHFIVSQVEEVVPFVMSASKLHVEVVDTIFTESLGGLVIEKTFSGFTPSWLQILVINSRFERNIKQGFGAGLEITYQMPSNQYDNYISIQNSGFTENMANKLGFRNSYGGAIAVHSEESQEIGGLNVKISGCDFVNNQAESGGGAIYITTPSKLIISNSTFTVNNINYISPEATFIKSTTNLFVDSSTFSYKTGWKESSLLEVRIHPHLLFSVEYLNVTIICLSWHRLDTSTEFQTSYETGDFVLKSFSVQCVPCRSSYYYPSKGIFSTFYPGNTTKVKILDHSLGQNFLQCQECPYGANCDAGNVKAKPNYWGTKLGNEVVFQQCPSGYCCSGTETAPCVGYDTCSGNREGILCGKCQENYSVSLLSEECIPNSECGVTWLWYVGLLAVTAYMLWYTFKDDILGIPSKLFTKFCLKEKSSSEDVDKGYFGILTYFIQAAATMRLSVGIDSPDNLTNIIQQIEHYVGLLLSIELSYVSYNLCPYKGITTYAKFNFKLIFLTSIYISWIVIFSLFLLASKLIAKMSKKSHSKDLNTIKLRFISGIVEIIKYTYGGFSGVIFICLTCVTVVDDHIWKYDGTVKCLNIWQTGMLSLCILYVIPFPLTLVFGLKLLENKRISSTSFLLGCIMPLPFLIIWIVPLYKSNKKSGSKSNKVVAVKEFYDSESKQDLGFSSISDEIINGFQGTYKKTEGGAQHWESIMILRRLLLGATGLLQNSIYQMSCCSILSIIFLMHHVYVGPFIYDAANYAESFSLLLLCSVSTISLLKSVYIQMGIVPIGPDVELFYVLRFSESAMILILILFVIVCEIRARCQKRNKI